MGSAVRGRPSPDRGYSFTAALWRWEARRDNWYFLTVPPELSDEIAAIPRPPRGFGGVRVRVTVGKTVWETSIFPASDGYWLPMKRAILRAEGIEEGDRVTVELGLV